MTPDGVRKTRRTIQLTYRRSAAWLMPLIGCPPPAGLLVQAAFVAKELNGQGMHGVGTLRVPKTTHVPTTHQSAAISVHHHSVHHQVVRNHGITRARQRWSNAHITNQLRAPHGQSTEPCHVIAPDSHRQCHSGDPLDWRRPGMEGFSISPAPPPIPCPLRLASWGASGRRSAPAA